MQVVDGPDTEPAPGLRRSFREEPGIRRVRRGRGLEYRFPDGRRVEDAANLARIQKLAIPPAWRDVWICADPAGHLQAVGTDARGRTQYLYHSEWRASRERAKFEQLIAFGRSLPAIRAEYSRLLRQAPLTPEKATAAVVAFIDQTGARVGNDRYVDENGTYGLSTLTCSQARVEGPRVSFSFVGKSGHAFDLSVRSTRLATAVEQCRALPGRRLFQAVDGTGRPRSIRSRDVNEFLRQVSGRDFTAKDFRTWTATVGAIELLAAHGCPAATVRARKQAVKAILAAVSNRIGNTPAVCRKAYIDPRVLEAFERGEFPVVRRGRAIRGLSLSESVALRVLARLASAA